MSEAVNNVRVSHDWDDIKDCWMAFKLSDGSTDGTIYDSRSDAIRLVTNRADQYFFVALRSCIHGMTPKEATLVLAMTRVQADRGRYHPAETKTDPIMPITTEDYMAELVSTKQGMPWIVPELGTFLGGLAN